MHILKTTWIRPDGKAVEIEFNSKGQIVYGYLDGCRRHVYMEYEMQAEYFIQAAKEQARREYEEKQEEKRVQRMLDTEQQILELIDSGKWQEAWNKKVYTEVPLSIWIESGLPEEAWNLHIADCVCKELKLTVKSETLVAYPLLLTVLVKLNLI